MLSVKVKDQCDVAGRAVAELMFDELYDESIDGPAFDADWIDFDQIADGLGIKLEDTLVIRAYVLAAAQTQWAQLLEEDADQKDRATRKQRRERAKERGANLAAPLLVNVFWPAEGQGTAWSPNCPSRFRLLYPDAEARLMGHNRAPYVLDIYENRAPEAWACWRYE